MSVQRARCCVVGAGRIGRGVATALLRARHAVVAVDPDAGAREEAAALGAEVAATPAEGARGADVVLLCVPDTPHVLAALDGDEGLERNLAPGAIVLLLSTVDPATPRALERRLAARGAALLDAPLSGGPERAAEGSLALMVGGDDDVVARARPVLDVLGHAVHVGPIGHGEIAKLANNLMGAVILAGIAEGLALADRAGADVRTVAEAIEGASGGSWLLRSWIPDTVLAGDYRARFSVDLMLKDLSLIRRLAGEVGVAVPTLETAAARFEQAAAEGAGQQDIAVVAALG